MYKSTEIRWFFESAYPRVLDWFAQRGITYDTVTKRTDHYLNYGQEDIGIKLREGRVEIKHRTSPPEMQKTGSRATGYMESWVKWSFGIERADQWAQKIINFETGGQEWTAVDKWRLGVKRTFNEQGELVFRDISENVSSACQVEFTRLRIRDAFYFTFGIEWYGEKTVPLDAPIMDKILGDSVFACDHSMGYAAFLMKMHALPDTLH